MKPKTITVPTWTLDNAGSYHKPGSTLTVDNDGGDGCITDAQAQQLADLDAQRAAKPTASPAPSQGGAADDDGA